VRLRTRLATTVASLLLALTGTLALASPASAASYGYISWTNNCGHAQWLKIIYRDGPYAGQAVVDNPSVPAGQRLTFRVASGRQYNVNASGGWKVVTMYAFADKVYSVALKAC
jgi:hypothetical protein